MLCAPSNRRRQFSYHTAEYFRVLSVFSWKKLTQTRKSVSNMASSDSHINKPQRGRPKIAEKLDVNINTGTQSIKAREEKQHWRLVQTYDASISISTRKNTFEPGRHKHKRACSCALRHPGSHVLFLVLILALMLCVIRVNQSWQNNINKVMCHLCELSNQIARNWVCFRGNVCEPALTEQH